MKTEKHIEALMEAANTRATALQDRINGAATKGLENSIVEALRHELTILDAQKAAFAWVLDG